MGRAKGVSSGGVASTTVAPGKGCESTGVVRPDTRRSRGKGSTKPGVVRPGYRGKQGGDEVGLTTISPVSVWLKLNLLSLPSNLTDFIIKPSANSLSFAKDLIFIFPSEGQSSIIA